MAYLFVGFGLVFSSAAIGGGNCTNTSWGFIPLPELGTNTFQGAIGGLYADGSNQTSPGHLQDGLGQASLIQPLDATGLPAPDGKIGVICLGMSNANQIFATLLDLLTGTTDPAVVLVNAAFGGMHAGLWANNHHSVWTSSVPAKLEAAGLTAPQVQVVLHYHGMAHSVYPPQPWPVTPADFQAFCEQIAVNTRLRLPNTRLMFWAPREYGGYATSINNPEPYAYYSGFALKWMITRQMAGTPELNWNPDRGPVYTAWMDWGPYTWADGLRVRSDGLYYECRDFQTDGTHLRMRARAKIAGLWAEFLHRHPLVNGWFSRSTPLPPMVHWISPPENVLMDARFTVALEAYALGLDSAIDQVSFYANSNLIATAGKPPWSVPWDGAPTGAIPVWAVARDTHGSVATSRVSTLRLQLGSGSEPQIPLAEDSFESGDLMGGSGWNEPAWSIVGPVDVTVEMAPPEGFWQARVRAGGSMVRSMELSGITNASLSFIWRGALPIGYTFFVEALDPTLRLLFSATNTQTTATTLTLPLDMILPAAPVAFRYRLAGPSTNAIVLVDAIQVTIPGPGSDPPRLQIVETSPSLFGFRWPTRLGGTYRLWTSSDLSDWSEIYFTTAEETSEAAWIESPILPSQRFYRIGGSSP